MCLDFADQPGPQHLAGKGVELHGHVAKAGDEGATSRVGILGEIGRELIALDVGEGQGAFHYFGLATSVREAWISQPLAQGANHVLARRIEVAEVEDGDSVFVTVAVGGVLYRGPAVEPTPHIQDDTVGAKR